MGLMEFFELFAHKIGVSETTVLVALLVLFIVVGNYVFESAKNTLFVGIASAIFPFFAVPLLGLDIDINFQTILYFVVLGTGLYHLYEIVKFLGKGSSLLMDILHGIALPFIWLWKLIRKLFGGR